METFTQVGMGGFSAELDDLDPARWGEVLEGMVVLDASASSVVLARRPFDGRVLVMWAEQGEVGRGVLSPIVVPARLTELGEAHLVDGEEQT